MKTDQNTIKMNRFSLLFLTLFFSFFVKAQTDKNQLGAWYMLFLDGKFSETSNFGFESDIQHRNFDAGRDLEQLMLRGGFSYKFSETKTKLTLGYAHITSVLLVWMIIPNLMKVEFISNSYFPTNCFQEFM